jgi:hypothetical protein
MVLGKMSQKKMKKKMNKIITIGYLGIQRCYLNISEEEAIKRYCDQDSITREEFDGMGYRIQTINFEDEFECYDIWEK